MGSPALPMIQTAWRGEGPSISRDFAVGPGRKPTVVIENAGEPVNGFSRTLDTVGEFASKARSERKPFPEHPILPKLRPIGRPREFASSITLDEAGPLWVQNDREFPGRQVPQCRLAALDHRECGRTPIRYRSFSQTWACYPIGRFFVAQDGAVLLSGNNTQSTIGDQVTLGAHSVVVQSSLGTGTVVGAHAYVAGPHGRPRQRDHHQ